MNKYPECEKLQAVCDESQKLGEFLEWLKGKYALCTWYSREELDEAMDESPEGFYTNHAPIGQILADYFEIDLAKVEAERRQILKEIRNGN